jgi:uncharacterized membrane protein YdbT with pleckstrin-like domain
MIRIAYGWLSKVQINVRRNRVELVTVRESVVQRRMGRATLNVATAGSFGEAGAEAPVALMVPRSEAERLVSELVPDCDVSRLEWKPFPSIYYRSQLFVAILGLLMFGPMAWGLGVIGFGQSARFFVLVVPVIAFMGILDEFLSRSKSGYALTPRVLAVRSGFLTRQTRIMPWDRVKVIREAQRPFWRRARAWEFTATGMARQVRLHAIHEADLGSYRASFEASAGSPPDQGSSPINLPLFAQTHSS